MSISIPAQNTLGVALHSLGEWEAGFTQLDKAVIAYLGALEEYPRQRAPLRRAVTQVNLATALVLMTENVLGNSMLNGVIRACRSARDVFYRSNHAHNVAYVEHTLKRAKALKQPASFFRFRFFHK